MQDFKKDSLIENYNRITKAKNDRLDEYGMILDSVFIKEEKPIDAQTRHQLDATLKNALTYLGYVARDKSLAQFEDDAMELQQHIEEFMDKIGGGN